MIRGKRLGIVGCGAIGTLVAKMLEKKRSSFKVTAVFDTFLDSSRSLSKKLKSRPRVCRTLAELFPQCDMVLEAASMASAPQVAEMALSRRKSVVLMSSGGFLFNREKLTRLAVKMRTKIYIPSGAICGLDGLRAARQLGRLGRLEITSTKPPRGFLGAPGLSKAQRLKLAKAKVPFDLYRGGVMGAIRRFPANVNVAATMALASGEPGKIKVRIKADPKTSLNQHEIRVVGTFGEMSTVTRNRPSAANPKTSALAIQAALALFERLESYVEVGN